MTSCLLTPALKIEQHRFPGRDASLRVACDPLLWVICCILLRELSMITILTSVHGSASILSKRARLLAWVDGSHASWGNRSQRWVLRMSPASSRVLVVFLWLPCSSLAASARGLPPVLLTLPWQHTGWGVGHIHSVHSQQTRWSGGRLHPVWR